MSVQKFRLHSYNTDDELPDQQTELQIWDTTHGKTVRLIVVVLRINIAAIEVQVVAVICTVYRTRPIVTIRPLIVYSTIRVVTIARGKIRVVSFVSLSMENNIVKLT